MIPDFVVVSLVSLVPFSPQKLVFKVLMITFVENNLSMTVGNNKIIWNSNYEKLLCYQKAVVIYDLTYHFCRRFISPRDRTFDQMIQAARSGKQNIVEGHADMATSKESGIKLFNIARGSHLELLEDYRDYLRVHNMRQWEDYSEEALTMAKLAVEHNDPKYFIELAESRPDSTIANMVIILIRQAISLTTKYIDRVCDNFSKEGGFRENMTAIRLKNRTK